MNRQERRRREREKNKITEPLAGYYKSPIKSKGLTRAEERKLQEELGEVGLLAMMSAMAYSGRKRRDVSS